MSPVSLIYRADLQGLRALAVALVVLAHAGAPGVAGGFVGVDVFFVLSGYLITGLLIQEYQAIGSIRWSAFIARRLRRLLPALLAMLTLVMAISVALLSTHEFSEQTASVAYAATWTSNLFFAFTAFDYFAELHSRDLFLHTWSLGVEEQFYLLWPGFLVSLMTLAPRFGCGWDRRKLLLAGLGLLIISSLLLSLHWSMSRSLWAFYLMPARLWQFALGAGVFVWLEMHPERAGTSSIRHSLWWLSAISAAGLLLIIGSAFFLHPGLGYPGWWALAPSLGAAMVIGAGSESGTGLVKKTLSHPGLVWLGDRSYSIYLWHWPLLMLGFAWGLQGNPSAVIALVLLAVVLSSASYRWIELPFWRGRFSSASPFRAIALSVLALSAVALTLAETNLMGRDGSVRGLELARSARLDMPAVYRVPGCDTWFHDAALQPCIFGSPDAASTAVLIGDSIGAQWYSLLPELLDQKAWRLIVLTKSSCAIVDEDFHYSAAGGSYRVCSQWRDQALDYVSALAPNLVFIGSATNYPFSDQKWVDGTRRVLDRLRNVTDRVIVIPGTPKLSFDGPGCLERWLSTQGHEQELASSASVCGESVSSDQASQVAGFLSQAVGAFDNASLLNLNDLVCPEGHCAAWTAAGVVVFRDQQHLTDSFVRAQAPAVRQRLQRLGLVSLQGE